MLLLFDMGTHFSMAFGDDRTTIQYGEFALAMANIDLNEVTEVITSYLQDFGNRAQSAIMLGQRENPSAELLIKSAKDGILPNALRTDMIVKIHHSLTLKIIDILNNAYLSFPQKMIIAKLFIKELEKNISSDSFNWLDESTYIPQLLMDKELRESLGNILLKESDFLSQKIRNTYTYTYTNNYITTSIRIDKKGIPRTVFHIENTLSYILLDLQKTLSNSKTILRCKNCNKLFYPISNKNKTYCRFIDPITGLTCNEAVRSVPKDEFAKKAKQARGAQQRLYENALNYKASKYIHNIELLDENYKKWRIECNQKKEEFRQLNDLQGFENWIKDTKYTAENLEKFGIRSPKDNSTADK